MASMDAFVRDFWKKLESVLQLLAAQLLAGHTGFEYHIGNTSNIVFPLRAYLTILRSNVGDELSITIDIKSREGGLSIESDIIGEEGVIVADGPSLELNEDLSEAAIQAKVEEWFKSSDRLFVEKSVDVETAINNLG